MNISKILYKSYQGGTFHNTAELMGFYFLIQRDMIEIWKEYPKTQEEANEYLTKIKKELCL